MAPSSRVWFPSRLGALNQFYTMTVKENVYFHDDLPFCVNLCYFCLDLF